MTVGLLVAIGAALAVVLALLALLLRRSRPADLSPLQARLDTLGRADERIEQAVREEARLDRVDAEGRDGRFRQEVANTLAQLRESVLNQLVEITRTQNTQLSEFSGQLATLSTGTDRRLEAVRETIEQRLRALQEGNETKLEQMRRTVDEQLQQTLERRLGESFRLVSDQLERVHASLGEMQQLADGVGDLKKVLSNVKSRGVMGEVMLGNLLEQVLTPQQYATNVDTRGDGRGRVEFAIRLPGRGDGEGEVVWLPIDAKFPQEDYLRFVEALDAGDAEAAAAAGRALDLRVRQCARDICDKYVSPPLTTEFAIMFLPTEGLFAEVVRRTGLVEQVQRECKVIVAGPTTLWALLNSLQMGFRTLAVQQRSAEVWDTLGKVKTEFGKFGDALSKVRKKLEEATNAVDKASTRTRVIERKLRDVQALPAAGNGAAVLALGPDDGHGLGELPDETSLDDSAGPLPPGGDA